MTQSVIHPKQSGGIRGVTGGPRQVLDLAGRPPAMVALLALALDRDGDPVEPMGVA